MFFKKAKKYVSLALASAIAFTSVFATSINAETLSIDANGNTTPGEAPTDAVLVSAVPSKTSVKAGEEFSVDFKIDNNPGFAGYSFTLEYNGVKPIKYDNKTAEGKAAIAELLKSSKVTYLDENTDEQKVAFPAAKINGWLKDGAATQAFADSFENGAFVASNSDIMFSLDFVATEDAAGSTASIILKPTEGGFISTKDGQTIPCYTKSADISVKAGPTKPADQLIYSIDENGNMTPAEVTPGKPVIEAIPSKDKVKAGEKFSVAFKISENSGFAGYSFTLKYDSNVAKPIKYDNKTDEGKAAIAELLKSSKVTYLDENTDEQKVAFPAAKINGWLKDGAATQAFADSFENGAFVASNSDIMFSLDFIAGESGTCNIILEPTEGGFISTKDGQTIPCFTKGGVVTISDEEEPSTAEPSTEEPSTAEPSTEEPSTAEPSTEEPSTAEPSTEEPSTAEPSTAPVTEAPVETTTRINYSTSGGGGSKKRGNSSTSSSTSKPSTDKTDKDDNKTDKDDSQTSKPSTSKPTTTSNPNMNSPKKVSNGITFTTNTGVKITIPDVAESSGKNFVDVKALTPWAADKIEKLAAAGIINGLNDTTFNPQGSTKRGDFMVMIAKLLGLEGTPSSNFSDVPKDKYYYNAIGLTKQLGIAAGMTADTFEPEATITREQVMSITARVLKLVGSLETASTSVLDKFKDKANIANWAANDVAALVSMGIVNGDTAGNINPKNNITRAETAVIMCGVYDIIRANAEKALKEAEKAEATTAATTEKSSESTTADSKSDSKSESTTSSSESTTVDSKKISSALEDYQELLEYIVAFQDYALESSDDQGKTLNERFIDDYKDDYQSIGNDLYNYISKYVSDPKNVKIDDLVKDTDKFYKTLKNFGDEIDLAITADDSKKAIKKEASTVKEAVDNMKKILEGSK